MTTLVIEEVGASASAIKLNIRPWVLALRRLGTDITGRIRRDDKALPVLDVPQTSGPDALQYDPFGSRTLGRQLGVMVMARRALQAA